MLMIIETRDHRERIWTATDEADLLRKVRAEAELRRSDADIETVADAIRYTQERDASRVEVLTQADYEAVEGWSDEVSATAARIWGLAPAGDLVLCESPDGWSLHAPGSTDDDIASGDAPYLASGQGSPTAADYAAARAELLRRAGGADVGRAAQA